MIALLAARALVSIAMQIRPTPTPPWARRLLHSRLRQRYRDPAGTVALLGLRPGARVLEIGPGSGLFTFEIARAIGEHGELVCVDLQPDMLRPLLAAVATAGVPQIELQTASAEHLPLRDAIFDVVIAISVLPMIPAKQRALAELRRVLKPAGLLVVSEELIEPEYVPSLLLRRWCERAGFTLSVEIRTPWWYLLQFRPKSVT